MSYITDLALWVDYADNMHSNQMLWRHIQSYGDGSGDPRIDGCPILSEIRLDRVSTAGGKVFTNDFYAGSHNYFNSTSKFVDHLRASALWACPKSWVLVIDDETMGIGYANWDTDWGWSGYKPEPL